MPRSFVIDKTIAPPGLGLLLRLKLTILRNRLRLLTDQSPLQLLLVILFVGTIWAGLYLIFDYVFIFMRRYEEQAIIAIPYIFHVLFVAMSVLLVFSTAVLVYGALFLREEPAFLLAAPNAPRNIVAVMYLESLFFASWSLVLLGLPLMLAIGQVQGLPWHFYPLFILAFLGFVPIPGSIGLLVALAVALYLPRSARRALLYGGSILLLLVVVWWSQMWGISASAASKEWLDHTLSEMSYLKAAMLPSSWVARTIQYAIEDKPVDALFYLAVTLSTALFLSWWANLIVAKKLLKAYGLAHAATNKPRRASSWASSWLTGGAFFYLPKKMRALILKDMRHFLRDPMQWTQLAILFGLLALYLFYLPRSRPEGFTIHWQALICFLNYGAVTLILSTFTSRFVFPMISLEGRQIWLVGLSPMSRERVLWAKFLFSLTLTAAAAMSITLLSIWALELPASLALIQASATAATCIGLCGLAIGLGAKMPSFDEPNASRIASGLGGTVNLIASVGLVAFSIALFGSICWIMAGTGQLNHINVRCAVISVFLIGMSLGAAGFAMKMGMRSFRTQEF